MYEMVFFVYDLINRLLQRISPRYRCRCFFQDYDEFRVRGDIEWNCLVLDELMISYGFRKAVEDTA